MTIKQELTVYAEQCISGQIVSCKKHKWACMRLLRDFKRLKEKEFPFEWNEDEAQKIVDWFTLLRHSKGILAGQPITLMTAQKFTLCQLYGWKKKSDGLRRFNKCFKELARKNAKSQEEAGIVLYEASYTSTKNGEISECYSAGTKREQSKLIFNEAKLMLRGSPLAMKFKRSNTRIEHKKTGSFIVPLSKEDGRTGDGTNPAVLVLDEYHQHPTTDFYDLAIGSNTKEPLLMIITTAGKDLNCPCYNQEYAYCSDVLDPDKPDIENDEYLIDIFEADSDIPLTDESYELLVEMANPVRSSYPEGRKKIYDDYVVAKQIPEKMTTFLTKVLNIWVQAKQHGYMDMAKWNACKLSELPFDVSGMPVYVGFDMSAKIDLTSVAFVVPYKDSDSTVKYLLWSHSFIPNREKLRERCTVDKMPYDAWERNRWLTVTDTEIVDQNAVMKYVEDFCSIEKQKLVDKLTQQIKIPEADPTAAPADKTQENASYIRACLKKFAGKPLTEVEDSLLLPTSTSPAGTNGEGYILPEDIQTKIRKRVRELKSFRSVCGYLKATALKGTYPVENLDSLTGLVDFTDGTDGEDATDFKFAQITYSLAEKAAFIKLSNTLLALSDNDLISYVVDIFGKKAVITENALAVAAIEKGKTAKTLADWKALKSSINKDLDPAALYGTVIVTNQDGFDMLDSALDEMGRPLLQPDPTQPTRRLFKGYPIHVFSNSLLKSTAATSTKDGYAPVYYGNITEGVKFVDLGITAFAASKDAGFMSNTTIARFIEYIDVIQNDSSDACYCVGQIKVADKTGTGT